MQGFNASLLSLADPRSSGPTSARTKERDGDLRAASAGGSWGPGWFPRPTVGLCRNTSRRNESEHEDETAWMALFTPSDNTKLSSIVLQVPGVLLVIATTLEGCELDETLRRSRGEAAALPWQLLCAFPSA